MEEARTTMQPQASHPHFKTAPTIEGDFPLDDSILIHLPPESTKITASAYGVSTWATTARILIEFNDGTHQKLFLKSALHAAGLRMLLGEYESMVELHKVIPEAIPQPIAFDLSNTLPPLRSFLLFEYEDMIEQSTAQPDPEHLCGLLAKLHKQSNSPTGAFGFWHRTPNGKTLQRTSWNPSWSTFFTHMLEDVIQKDTSTNGAWEALKHLQKTLLPHIVNRLLDPLEGIKPSLLHGDIWNGNIATSSSSAKDILLFDAGSYYAHHEMELVAFHLPYNHLRDPVYLETYIRLYGAGAISEPKGEFEDRMRLYCVYHFLLLAVNHRAETEKGWEGRRL